MTTRFFGITAVALAAALSACAASASSPRVASAQASGSQLHFGTAPSSRHCGYDQGGFNTPDAMKLPKDAFCSPQ
jgi:curli biogenesis system outer membrane secretion channel CsgG